MKCPKEPHHHWLCPRFFQSLTLKLPRGLRDYKPGLLSLTTAWPPFLLKLCQAGLSFLPH